MKVIKWSIKEQATFLKRIGELLERGYPLSDAVESVMYYLPHKKRENLKVCILQLKEGYSFYKILSTLRFDSYLIGFVYFAEQHGGIARSFLDGSHMVLKRNQELDKFKRLFFYPLFLIIVTLILFIFVEQILIPQFLSLFKSMNLQENFFMVIVKAVGEGLPKILYMAMILIFSLFIYYYTFFRKLTNIGQKRILTNIPFIGKYFRLIYTHYLTLQLSYLLSSGIPILDCLKLFEQNVNQPFYKEIGNQLINKLKSGDKLDIVLTQFNIFEKELARIVRHGQENGKLDEELLFYSNYCSRILEENIDSFMKKIQPCLYSFIGLLIVSIYLAVLLPMFHLLNNF